MGAVDTGKITTAQKLTSRELIARNAKGSLPTATSPFSLRGAVSGEVSAIVAQSGDPLGSTGLTLSGVVDDEAEIVLDALKVADA